MKALLALITVLVILATPGNIFAQDIIDYNTFKVQDSEQNIQPPAVISPTFDWRWLLLPLALLPLLYLIFKNEEEEYKDEYLSTRDYYMRPVYQSISKPKSKKNKKSSSVKSKTKRKKTK